MTTNPTTIPTPLAISATSHGINYLPEYWAQATGLFSDVGLAVTDTPCDPWTGVLDDLESGAAEVALGGLWVPAMYSGTDRGYVAIGQLNARFPKVVLTREPVEDFDWSWLAGRTVLVPGAGGTANYEYPAGLMREAGIAAHATRFVRDLDASLLVDVWCSGLGDAFFGDLFTATTLIHRGVGHVALRLAEFAGLMPNSVYYVKRNRLDELRDRLVPFMSAITTAMAQLDGETDLEEAITLAVSHWPASPEPVLRDIVTELAGNGTWSSSQIEPAAAERWTQILYDAGLTTTRVGFDQICDASICEAVAA